MTSRAGCSPIRVRASCRLASSRNLRSERTSSNPMIGLVLALAVAIVATLLGRVAPIVGAPVFAIVLGTLIVSVRTPAESLRPGIAFASKQLLQWSIVLLGAHLSLSEIVQGGAQSLPVMLGTLVIVLVLAYVVGRALGLDRDIRRLVRIGTAICG